MGCRCTGMRERYLEAFDVDPDRQPATATASTGSRQGTRLTARTSETSIFATPWTDRRRHHRSVRRSRCFSKFGRLTLHHRETVEFRITATGDNARADERRQALLEKPQTGSGRIDSGYSALQPRLPASGSALQAYGGKRSTGSTGRRCRTCSRPRFPASTTSRDALSGRYRSRPAEEARR